MRRTKKALIVEEDQVFAAELRSLLNSLGFTVTMLRDPGQVAETLGSRQYEVALVNIAFPKMNWRGTLRTLKHASRTTSVITLARSADEDDMRLALHAGTYMVMDRPLTPEQLTDLISVSNDGLFVVLRG